MHNRNFVASLSIGGEKTPAFSGTTLQIPPTPDDLSQQIIDYSRQAYSRPRAEVEREIRERARLGNLGHQEPGIERGL